MTIISNVNVGLDYKSLGITLDGALFNSDHCFVGRASGESMRGVGIFSGDILIIDRKLDVQNYDVIVAGYNGLFVCKIADLKNNQLLSSNEDYPPVKITPYDEFTLEGVVSSSIRLLRNQPALGD
jgi:DNA polymerase V